MPGNMNFQGQWKVYDFIVDIIDVQNASILSQLSSSNKILSEESNVNANYDSMKLLLFQ